MTPGDCHSPATYRVCSNCGEVLNPATNRSRCRACFNEAARARYHKDQQWPGHLRRRYGMTVEDYDALLSAQNNCCAVCGTDDPGKNRFHVDHDHACCPAGGSCGKCVRGLLCGNCNRGIGYLKDDAAIVAKALEYLTAPSRRQSAHTPHFTTADSHEGNDDGPR